MKHDRPKSIQSKAQSKACQVAEHEPRRNRSSQWSGDLPYTAGNGKRCPDLHRALMNKGIQRVSIDTECLNEHTGRGMAWNVVI